MIILCRSSFLASELAGISGGKDYTFKQTGIEQNLSLWLKEELSQKKISLVFYESGLTIDPSPFRIVSPSTRFVFIADTGEDAFSRKALDSGAQAVIHKPLDTGEVLGVLSLVSR